MKILALSFALLLCISDSFSQQISPLYYEIRFADKGVNTEAGINPSAYLSEKAVERRIRQKIAFDQSDMPVCDAYVKELKAAGFKIVSRSRWLNLVVVEATPAQMTATGQMAFVTAVKPIGAANQASAGTSFQHQKLESVEPWSGTLIRKPATDVYDYGAAYTQIAQMNGQYLHNQGFSGQGMTIAVIDAGFNSVDIMPCFDSLRANNQILGVHDFAQPGNNVYATTMHPHGTWVLSCMAAYQSGLMIGTAPKADYWLLRSEVGESEKLIEEYYWASAAEFADSVGVDLINSSLGYTQFDPSDSIHNHTYADMDGNTTVCTIAADMAASKGILVVNSAGNEGSSAWRYIGAPADGDSVFTIGAVNGEGIRAGFSSLGPTYDGRIKPTVCAMGSGSAIFSTSGVSYGSGTSFSSPITCGMTACFWQALPNLTNMEIIEQIKYASSQSQNPDSLMGWGIPDFQKAFTTYSVPEVQLRSELTVYPNPFTDQFNIALPEPIQGEYQITIASMSGKNQFRKTGKADLQNLIPVSGLEQLPAGVYSVTLSTGNFIRSTRLIKF
jgi:serine protease AprX